MDRWTAVDRYIADLLVPPDPALDAALAASAAAGLPPHQRLAEPGQAAAAARPRSSGRARSSRSARSAATARSGSPGRCRAGGRLITLEYDPKHAEVARANLARAGLADVVDLRLGPALETLPRSPPRRGPFDLIFIDADKPSYPEYLDWSLSLSRPGTLIIADNVVRDGAVVDAASDDASVAGRPPLHRAARRRAAGERHRDPDRRRQGLRRLRPRPRRSRLRA